VHYYHVSDQKPDGGFFRLVKPTFHSQKYKAKCIPRQVAVSSADRDLLLNVTRQVCGQCPKRFTCPTLSGCALQNEILAMMAAFRHRAHQFVEHLFEGERRKSFSHLPSRFESMFCWESLDDANWFRDSLRAGKGNVYLVIPIQADIVTHRGDIRWLDCLWNSVPAILQRAKAYWNGEPCPDSGGGRWEVLVPCDLKVLDRIS